MSAIYENKNNEEYVILGENDYINVIRNEKKEKCLIIKRKGEKRKCL